MGEVYRAIDTRLDRTVAIKVLPDHVASDPEFRRRFDREARVISSLNHPHICVLLDVGRQDEIDFLVMEYLEGETLAQRLANGPLPLDQALRYASEIADALDKAHRKGVVHRDLKPGNVMITPRGAKLLDFGVAKRAPAVAGEGDAAITVSSPLTEATAVIGTLQYMAPEQIEGREADGRTDIFALAAVLYEMLTGRRPFEGTSRASLMSAILRDEPMPVTRFLPAAPTLLDHLVRRCLSKDPDDRWQTAADVMRELRWLMQSTSRDSGPQPDLPRRSTVLSSRRRERLLWGSAVAAVTLAAAFFAFDRQPPPAPAEWRLEVTTPPTMDPVGLAMSPDGKQVVYVAMSDGRPRLWLRRFDTGIARALSGSDFAEYPFWSPDNRSVGFFADGKLKRLEVGGGSAQVLAAASNPRGAAWMPDDTIVFGAGGANGLFRLPSGGGVPQPLTRLGPNEQSHRFPNLLPGEEHLLYYVVGTPDVRGVYAARINGSDAVRLLDADTAAVYALPGRLLFVRQGTLFAQNFDAEALTLSGSPFAVAEGIARDPLSIQLAAVSASAAGPIAYRTGGVGLRRRLVWFDRQGREVGQLDAPETAGANNISISGDGRHVAWDRTAAENVDVWTMDLQRGRPDRITLGPMIDAYPIWSPDGARLAFGSIRGAAMNLYWKSLTQSAAEQPLLVTAETKAATDWSRDGRFILFRSSGRDTGYDLWALPMNADAAGTPLLVAGGVFDERDGQFSPDGRWIAYQSNESDRTEVYIRRFPTADRPLRISSDGGAQPRWSRDGAQLFYISLEGRLVSVPVTLGADSQSTTVGAPESLFFANVGSALQGAVRQQYLVAPDGDRFLVNTVVQEQAAPITIVVNWTGAPADLRP
jgi:serine/threonine protein kinase